MIPEFYRHLRNNPFPHSHPHDLNPQKSLSQGLGIKSQVETTTTTKNLGRLLVQVVLTCEFTDLHKLICSLQIYASLFLWSVMMYTEGKQILNLLLTEVKQSTLAIFLVQPSDSQQEPSSRTIYSHNFYFL